MNNIYKLKVTKRVKKIEKQKRKDNDPIEVRDLREKFFVVDDAYMNGWARLLDWSVSMVYLMLCRHVGMNQSCFPSIALLAEKLNMSERHVARSIKVLELHQLIKVDHEIGQPNIYWLTDKKHWKKLIRLGRKFEPDTINIHGSEASLPK
jgi:AraC-like DNA-binding protein